MKDQSFENYVFPLLGKQASGKQGPGPVHLTGISVSQVSLRVNEQLKVTLSLCEKKNKEEPK